MDSDATVVFPIVYSPIDFSFSLSAKNLQLNFKGNVSRKKHF